MTDRIPHTDPELRSVLRLLLRDATPSRVLSALATVMAASSENEASVRAVRACAGMLATQEQKP